MARAATRTVRRVARPAPRKPVRRARRATYHHGDLARALVDAAVAIIDERGAEAFTLRESARRLGVNHRAAYRHFADKDALLAAVAEQGFRGLIDATRAQAAGITDPAARLAAAARAYVAFAAEHPAHFRVMFAPRHNEGAPRSVPSGAAPFATVDALVAEAYALLEAEVRVAMATGAFAADPGPHPVIALWSAMHGLASLVLMKRVDVPPGRLGTWVDRIFERSLRGLR